MDRRDPRVTRALLELELNKNNLVLVEALIRVNILLKEIINENEERLTLGLAQAAAEEERQPILAALQLIERLRTTVNDYGKRLQESHESLTYKIQVQEERIEECKYKGCSRGL